MQPPLTTPGLTITHDAANGWLHLSWRGMHDEEAFKECCLKILDKVCLTQVSRILNDATHDHDGWGELTRWVAQDFLHTLADVGVLAIAWVLPEDLQARLDVHRVLTKVESPLVDTFTDPEAAFHWLQRLPSTSQPEG